MKPEKPLTDPSFKYRDSAHTDVRLTWDEARAKLKEEEEKRAKARAELEEEKKRLEKIVRPLTCRKDRNG